MYNVKMLSYVGKNCYSNNCSYVNRNGAPPWIKRSEDFWFNPIVCTQCFSYDIVRSVLGMYLSMVRTQCFWVWHFPQCFEYGFGYGTLPRVLGYYGPMFPVFWVWSCTQ